MNTLIKSWLALGVILSLLRAQNPWTNWDVYRDSTGNGVNPVSGFTPVCPDTFWLIVDTAGMSAAGVVEYTWFLNGISGMVLYADGPMSPTPFPPTGLSNKRKVRVAFFGGGNAGNVILKVSYSSSTAAIAKPLVFRQIPTITVLSPRNGEIICSASSVSFSLNVTGADSFIVQYGSGPADTLKNRLNFTLTPPSTSSWTIIIRAHYCNSWTATTLTLYRDASSAPAPVSIGPTTSFCPGDTVSFALSPFANITGYTSLTLTVRDPSSNPVFTATTLPAKWHIPTGAASGFYTVQLSVNFPAGCGGPATGSASFRVHDSGSLPTPSISPSGPNYCVGTPINLTVAPTQGLVSWDIGDNGTWDYVGTNFITHIFPSATTSPVPIRIRQDLGCVSRSDLINWTFNPGGRPNGFLFIPNPPGVICPGQTIPFRISASNFLISQPGSSLQWQASWLNSGNPFNGYSLDTAFTVPSALGNYYLKFTLTNTCGTYTDSTLFTVGGSSSSSSPLQVLGIVCTGGESVRIITPNQPGLQNVKYFVSGSSTPIGPVNPGDTVSISVPSGGATVTAELNYGCVKMYASAVIQPTNAKAKIQNVSMPNVVCIGAPVSVFITGEYGNQVSIYDGSTLIAQTTPSTSNPPYFGVSLPFLPPSQSTTLMIVVTGCGGNDTVYRPLTIAGIGATANFTAPMSGCVGQPVTFRRLGTNTGIIRASWNFGDGSPIYYDTSMTVTRTYSLPGVYTVQLSVQSRCGSTNMTRTLRIYANPPTLSALNITSSGLQINYSVNATDADSVKWFFNHPSLTPAALGTSGTYTYATSGTYTVAVRAYNGCGVTTLTQTVTVSTTGLSTKSRSGEWVLYPNPTRSSLYIAHQGGYAGAAQIRLHDLNGRLVGQYAVESLPARLDFNLPAGLYHAQIIHDKGIETLPFAVE